MGDGPDLKSGLGRIGHDLAWLLSSMPEFRVGYMGMRSFGRNKFPWTQYSFSEQWGETRIMEAWNDLAQGLTGIVLTVWDASRLYWFADPVGLPPKLQDFLGPSRPFQKWGYFMQDAEGVRRNMLPEATAHAFSQYDRVLLASKWAHGLTANSIQHKDLDWLPHPINRATFKPEDRFHARSMWNIGEDENLIGCVMANQERKHWPVVFETIASMKNARLWMHTDILRPVPGHGYWNLEALACEYGIGDRIVCDNRALGDRELAVRYSACDATVVISGGEGFCYPVVESLSCGVPVVTGSYGAQAELATYTVPPRSMQICTQYNVARACYSASDFRVELEDLPTSPEACQERVKHLDMPLLGIEWKKWLKKGLVQK